MESTPYLGVLPSIHVFLIAIEAAASPAAGPATTATRMCSPDNRRAILVSPIKQPYAAFLDRSQSSACSLCFALGCAIMQSRVRNSASPEQLAKVLRGGLPSGPKMDLVTEGDIEKVIANFHDLLCDILRATARPTKVPLRAAATQAWDFLEFSSCDLFANRMVMAVSHCRTKSYSMTSGKKYSKPMLAVISLLKQQESEQKDIMIKTAPLAKPRSKLSASLRRLARKTNDPSPSAAPPTAGSSQQSSGLLAELTSLQELYGQPSGSASSSSKDIVVDVLSSQDVASSQDDPLPIDKAAKRSFAWFCNKDKVMKRIEPSGEEKRARMEPGPNAMALAIFDDEPPIETEVPNLIVQAKVFKRPAAATVAPSEAAAPALVEDTGGSQDEAPAAADAEEPELHPEATSVVESSLPSEPTARNILYSRVYHKVKNKAKKRGLSNTDQASEARAAANLVCLRAQLQGLLT